MTGFHFTMQRRNWIEPLFALGIIASLIYPVWHLFNYAFLPQPFFHSPDDLWADWFNTAYFAYDRGTYDAWRTLYPPLSFLFLDLFTLDHCYPIHDAGDWGAGLQARYCDWWGIISLHASYVLAAGLAAYSFYKQDRRTALWRSIALGMGFPLLDGLERGNLVIVAFLMLILGFGPIFKSARARALAVGLAINFKVYLIAALIPLLLRRRWRFVEYGVLATIAVYIVSFAMFGEGTILEIYHNIQSFNEGQAQADDLLGLWYSTTFVPHMGLLNSSVFYAPDFIGSRLTDFLLVFIPFVVHSTQALIVVAAVAVWLRPHVVPYYRVVNLGLLFALITSEAGGYTQVYFIFFVFLERFEGLGRKSAIIACYLLSPSSDIPVEEVLQPVVRHTFLWGTSVFVSFYIMLGPFFRPLLILTVPAALSLVTIRAVWVDIRENGWDFRWRFTAKNRHAATRA
jgi:hypothetical protein